MTVRTDCVGWLAPPHCLATEAVADAPDDFETREMDELA